MTVDEQHRVLEIARQSGEIMRTLAHSTRGSDHPGEIYLLTSAVVDMTSMLPQVLRQVGQLHAQHSDSVEAEQARQRLEEAAELVAQAATVGDKAVNASADVVFNT